MAELFSQDTLRTTVYNNTKMDVINIHRVWGCSLNAWSRVIVLQYQHNILKCVKNERLSI